MDEVGKAVAGIDAAEQAIPIILREQRETLGWSRRQVVEHFLPKVGVKISDRTLLTYENLRATGDGQPTTLRAVTVRRLLELAAAYDVPASTLLLEAEIRAGRPPRCGQCGHDLERPMT